MKKIAKDELATLIHVSVGSDGVTCRRGTGIHDISICKRRKRFIAIFFFFSPFFSIAVSRRVYREFRADTPGKTAIPRWARGADWRYRAGREPIRQTRRNTMQIGKTRPMMDISMFSFFFYEN